MDYKVKILKQRKHTHQFTEVSFSLQKEHNVKVEFIAGRFGGIFKTDFIFWVDGEPAYQKTLYISLFQIMRFSTKIESMECSIKYKWFSGIWHGHIYFDGKSIV